jgi:threonine dehydrogenase-like Zn-dependent dehydrogenase
MKRVLQEHQTGQTVVRAVPSPSCPPAAVLLDNTFSAISSGTERARVQLSQMPVLGKAGERPDLVRESSPARRDRVRSTLQTVQRRLSEEVPVGYSCAGTVVEVGERSRGLLPGDRFACAGSTARCAEFATVPASWADTAPDSRDIRPTRSERRAARRGPRALGRTRLRSPRERC